MKRNIIFILIAGLCAFSCVYPFTPEVPESDGRLVVEGDIMIGEQTTVLVSYLADLNGSTYGYGLPAGVAWIEASDGKIYNGKTQISSKISSFVFETQNADPKQRYKLHFRDDNGGEEYESEWLDVIGSGTIDSLYMSLDEKFNAVRFYVDMHNSERIYYYRLSYDEDWEYHSQILTFLKYTPPKKYGAGNYGVITEDTVAYYNCWSKDKSKSIMLVNAQNLSEDRFVKHEYTSLPRTSRKISTIYSSKVYVQGLTKNAYDYWENIEKNSNITGSLFAPIPSDMPGNVKCISDTTKAVIGYLSASCRASKRMFYYNIKHSYYVSAEQPFVVRDSVPEKEWYQCYLDGNVPVYFLEELNGYSWSPARCVDCRVEGGTTNKPDFWPEVY